jgi:hypothetical protein
VHGKALTTVVIVLAFGTLGTGLWAARLWNKSSKIVPVPTWAEAGGTEPGDEMESQMGWLAGLLKAGRKVAELNSAAARWTAISVFLAVAATLAGLWSD